MGILENLKKLEKEELNQIIELFSVEKNRNNEKVFQEIEKIYLENPKKLYSYLPLETYNFLKFYFENNGLIPDNDKFLKCSIIFEDFGLCPLEENIEFEIKGSESFIKVDLDLKVVQPLFNFLNENRDIISKENELYNAISGILNCYLGIKFTDFLELLKGLNILKSEYEIMDFLKYKANSGIYDFYFNSNDELCVISRYLKGSNEILEELLNSKEKRVIYSLEEYIKLSHNYVGVNEVSNIVKTIDVDKREEDDDAYISYYLIRNTILNNSLEDCLKDIESMVAIDINNSIVKENIVKFYNKFPIALKGGAINSKRMSV